MNVTWDQRNMCWEVLLLEKITIGTPSSIFLKAFRARSRKFEKFETQPTKAGSRLMTISPRAKHIEKTFVYIQPIFEGVPSLTLILCNLCFRFFTYLKVYYFNICSQQVFWSLSPARISCENEITNICFKKKRSTDYFSGSTTFTSGWWHISEGKFSTSNKLFCSVCLLSFSSEELISLPQTRKKPFRAKKTLKSQKNVPVFFQLFSLCFTAFKSTNWPSFTSRKSRYTNVKWQSCQAFHRMLHSWEKLQYAVLQKKFGWDFVYILLLKVDLVIGVLQLRLLTTLLPENWTIFHTWINKLSLIISFQQFSKLFELSCFECSQTSQGNF